MAPILPVKYAPITKHPVAAPTAPAPVTPSQPEHPLSQGPFGAGSATPTGPIAGPPLTAVAVARPAVTVVKIVAGIASFRIGGGTVVVLPLIGSGAVQAMVRDTALKRLPHNGVIDQAMALNLVSLLAA